MVRINLGGINTTYKQMADGSRRRYYYHRATGKRLRGERGSSQFIQDYAAAEKLLTRSPTDNLSSLFHSYTLSPKFTSKAKTTKADYIRCMTRIEDEFGTLPIGALNDPDVRRLFIPWHEALAKSNGARTGDYHMSVLSAVLTWAHKRGLLHGNHAIGFEKLHHADRSEMIWLPEHVHSFMKVASIPMQRALILALHTGQRQNVLLKMAWSNYDGKGISVIKARRNQKARPVYIPCTPALKSQLDSWTRNGLLLLTTEAKNVSYKKRHFSNHWKETADEAGIKGLTFHDLRGTAVTMLSEGGSSIPEICSMTGHSLEGATRILERYLPKTRYLAEAAALKLHKSKQAEFANRLQTKLDNT